MTTPFRIGLLRLADSLPILMAHELGMFARAGIDAELVVEPSWANIADGLSWGRLDAAVIFPPLAIMTALGKRGRPTPLRVVANLSYGGNTIVLADEARLSGAAPRFAVVHSYSTHFLLLRRYLEAHCPRALEHLVIMPPDAMLDALAAGTIDGFCAGPPWGMAAEHAGLGRIVSGSAEIRPGHLEKQCVVTENWARNHPAQAARLGEIIASAVARCLDVADQETAMDVLTRPVAAGGLSLPAAAVRSVLPGSEGRHAFGLIPPREASSEWLIAEMRALGWIDATDDLRPWLVANGP